MLARDRVDLDDFLVLSDLSLDALQVLVLLGAQRELHECHDVESDAGPLDPGRVAGDHAGFLEPTDAPVDLGLRQVHTLGQHGQRGLRVGLQ
ncbi:hypothetical protein BH10PSE17_BH10PSE17_25790 [soil metagenome]